MTSRSWVHVPCEACGSEGRIIRGWGSDGEYDAGPCPYCKGSGMELIEAEPAECDDDRALTGGDDR